MDESPWTIPCVGDDEEFEPSPEEQEAIYFSLINGNIPELSWKCPGRRAPTPDNKEEPKINENVDIETPTKTDFDFMDDAALPTMRVRTQNSKVTAKKKTANFAGVIDALKKQRLNSKDNNS